MIVPLTFAASIELTNLLALLGSLSSNPTLDTFFMNLLEGDR